MPGGIRGRAGRGWDPAPRRASDDDPASAGSPARRGRRWAGRSATSRDGRDGPSQQPDPAEGEAGVGEEGRDGGRGAGASKPVDPAERAREICLRQLAVRPRTRAELSAALTQRGIDDEVAAQVLDRYGEVGIIDDQAFARAWVTSRHHSRGLAKTALASELKRKGVDAEAVGIALDQLDPEAEAETARALVERKLRSDSGRDPAGTARRLVGMLARKGYPAGMAFRIVREAMADRAAEQAAELTDEAADDLEHAVLGAAEEQLDTE